MPVAGLRLQPGGWTWALLRLLGFAAMTVLLAVAAGMLWLALPLPDTEAVVFLGSGVTAAAALGAGVVMLRLADGRRPAALGLGLSRTGVLHAGVGLALGAAALAAAAAALLLTGALRYGPQQGTAAGWLATVAGQAGIFVVAAFAEEVVFRGYAFQVLARAGGGAVAVLVTALLFAWAHGDNPDVGVIALANIFLAGIMLGIAFLRTASLWFVTAVHVGWNWAMATLLDLPVSGLSAFDTPLYQPVIGGPAWWSGGGFGPEGGLVGTIGFCVALAALYRLRAVRPDPVVLRARPLMIAADMEQA